MKMAKRIQWDIDDVSFRRGNFETIIARFDNCKKWFRDGSVCSTQTAKSSFRRLAQRYGATRVEVKYLFGRDEEPTEDRTSVIDFKWLPGSEEWWFYIEKPVPEGSRRQFHEFRPEELFA